MITPISLFSVPVWKSSLPDFKNLKELFLTAVTNYKNNNPSEQKSNVWGYQSPKEIHSVAELSPLFDYVSRMASGCANSIKIRPDIAITEAWVNFNSSRQCMNNQHIHGGVFSGIFYLNVPPESGKLVLANPAINHMWQGLGMVIEPSQYTSETIIISPIEGDIIMWPSYLPHSVGTNNHDSDRISIAFNLYMR